VFETAGHENVSNDGLHLTQNQLTAALAQGALQGDQLRQKDAVQTLGGFRAEAERHLATAFLGDQCPQFRPYLVNLCLLKSLLPQANAEDLASAINFEVTTGAAHE
jgi:hypothetical protein